MNLKFGPGGRLAGRTSCKRYFAGYSLMDEGLTTSQTGATRMDCASALMRREQVFRQSQAKVEGLAFRQVGVLELQRAGGGTILARGSAVDSAIPRHMPQAPINLTGLAENR